MILCSIQKAKQKFFAFPQPRECSLIACSTIWGIFHSRVAMKRLLYKKNSVALASLSDFVKASCDTSFYINEFQGRA